MALLLKNDVKTIIELIEHNECGVAYEILCTQLYEYDVQISSNFYEKIFSLGKAMEMQPSYWLPLKELIKNGNDQGHKGKGHGQS
ncbi:MAG: MafI family immunity protein [Verrucomicrobia bacterium]|nr:MafI family immunity protein [Verrucomicrobiota bacterium]